MRLRHPHPRAHTATVAATALLAVAALCCGGALHARSRDVVPVQPAQTAPDRMAEVETRDHAIRFYTARVDRDPEGALDLAQLAGLYLQRARETGSHDDLHAAEDAARLSLQRSRARNGRSMVTLANALMGQHRFAEAAAVARELVAAEPDIASYRALEAEIALERGDDATVYDAFAELDPRASVLAVAPRRARWLQMQGRDAEAYALSQAALTEAKRARSDLPREQLAWFYGRAAEAALRCNRLREADAAIRTGLEVEPADPRLWVVRSRVAARRGDARDAQYAAERAVTLRPDTPALAAAYDAAATLGDSTRMWELDVAIEARGREHEGVDRAWLAYLLDRGRLPAFALALAESDAKERRDPQGCHLLARALFANGMYREARAAMTDAMRWGTRDAGFMRTTAAIEAALGHEATSRDWARLAEFSRAASGR